MKAFLLGFTVTGTKREILLQRLLDLFTIHQQRWLFVGNAYGSNLSSIEFYVLLELSVDPEATATQLAARLCLERRLVAHAIQTLTRKKHLSVTVNPADKRARKLRLLKRAKDALIQHDENSARHFHDFIQPLSKTELTLLLTLFHDIADGCEVPAAVPRTTEEARLAAGRRCFRALGMIGPSFLGSDFSSTDWNFLWLMQRSPYGISPGSLSHRLQVPKATTSHTLRRLKEKGLAADRPSIRDGRGKIFTLTNAGSKQVSMLQQSFANTVNRGCQNYKNADLKELLRIFELYVGLHPREVFVDLNTDLRFDILDGSQAPPELRGFILERLVKTGRAATVEDTVISPESLVYVLWKKNSLCIVTEVRITPKKNATFAHFESASKSMHTQYAKAMLRFIKADLLARAVESATIPTDSPTASALSLRYHSKKQHTLTISLSKFPD